MTVRENMAFPLVLAKVDKATIKQKVEDAAEILELTQHLDRKPANLSGGQRQRVAMGRAIVRDPKAFLMDEPLSNLDAKLRVQMRTQVSRLQKRLGTTTVYVTHDQTEAMTLGDRVVVMRAGLVQQIGTPTELYDRPVNLFVAGFIGSPSMNFLLGHVEQSKLHTALGDMPLSEANQRALDNWTDGGREVIVGIRPEDFEDAALVRDANRGAVFTGDVDVVESMGSDIFAYFTVAEDKRASSEQLEDLAKDTGAAEAAVDVGQLVTRLDPASRAREGQPLKVWYDTDKAHIFDPASGKNLTLAET